MPLQYAAGVSPTYWIAKALETPLPTLGSIWWTLLAGTGVSLLYLILLYWRFTRQTG